MQLALGGGLEEPRILCSGAWVLSRVVYRVTTPVKIRLERKIGAIGGKETVHVLDIAGIVSPGMAIPGANFANTPLRHREHLAMIFSKGKPVVKPVRAI